MHLNTYDYGHNAFIERDHKGCKKIQKFMKHYDPVLSSYIQCSVH